MANKIDILQSDLKVLYMAKAQIEIRGKEFTKVFMAFVDLFSRLFRAQTDIFLEYIDLHSHLFNPDGGIIIEKTDEFGNITPDDTFMESLGEMLVNAHMIGQDGTNTEVGGQVGATMEVNNAFATSYAKNRAWELMSGVDDTTKQSVRDIFSKAWAENWQVSEIKDKIIEQFSQFSKYRASLIATMEVANAYEVGKKDQFAQYQDRFMMEGFKRSQTQHDGNVRFSHNMNEIDGWIPERTLFSGTETDHAPHGFNCRCVTLRRLVKPEPDDIVKLQFEKDSSAYISDEDRIQIAKAVQTFRSKAPYLPKVSNLSDFWDTVKWSIAVYRPSTDTLAVNYIGFDDLDISEGWAVSWSYEGVAQKNAIIYHELGHFLDHFITSKASTSEVMSEGITWSSIYDDVVQAKMSLLTDWQSGAVKWVEYPVITVMNKGYEAGMKEVFAESVSGYIMGKTDILNKDMQEILDIIFLQYVRGK